tara:strand:- start:1015 stop:1206 length:192 start_codon:yes stop_codon:yes gene_type:complete
MNFYTEKYKLGSLTLNGSHHGFDYEIIELSFENDNNLKAIYCCGANASSTNYFNEEGEKTWMN